ncbi:MAG: exodeoxyribonuclease VII small subunit [Magnetococcales bacterium]|nr:exodeoxyribonuclease VII small subunit [Magnetococcales bacterium]
MKSPNFESDLGRLEEIVQRLETGDLPLEDGVTTFEEGIRLARSCQNQLDKAEKRMEELMDSDESNPSDGV